MPDISQSRSFANNVDNLPLDGFRRPDPGLAISTPGPRVATVRDIFTPHTASDSLRIINHLQLSNDDCRYVKSISLVGLNTEYSVKKLRSKLMGNYGKGWVEADKISVKKWFRKPENEDENYKNGQPARKEIVIGKIPKEHMHAAVQHWADILTDQGQYVDMQSLENCPEDLHDSVVLVLGNDSGQGYCREGLRFCNRVNANSGGKVFVTTIMQGTDKSLSLFQKQALFSSLSALRNITTIKMGGKEQKLIKISCMDYEAAAEDFGTQVRLFVLNNILTML